MKLQYFGHLMQRTDSLEKTLMLGKIEGRRRGRQRMRQLMASPTPRVYSNSCPLLLPLSIFPSSTVFSDESVLCIRWPKYWSVRFSVSPSNEYSGPISFWFDWFDLLAVQGALKNLFQDHSSKASILQPSALFIVQLSHPYMTTGKAITLT